MSLSEVVLVGKMCGLFLWECPSSVLLFVEHQHMIWIARPKQSSLTRQAVLSNVSHL